MRLLLLADTHVPRRAADLPAPVWAQVDAADVVVHAGDWVDLGLLERLTERAGSLVAVCGNNDGPALRARLPAVARCEIDGVRLAVVHDTGPTPGRGRRMRADFPDTDVLIFGHSHVPYDETYQRLRLLNPGSPTDRRRQPAPTYLTATITGGGVAAVRLHSLQTRGR